MAMSVGRQPDPMAGLPASPPLAVRVPVAGLSGRKLGSPTTIGLSAHQRDRGRIETRWHTVCHKVDWMTSDRHYPGEPVFPDLAMIGRIETAVDEKGKIE